MTIIEAVKKAKAGDSLGETFRRDVWIQEALVSFSENSNTMEERTFNGEWVPWVPELDDLLATDWNYVGPYLGSEVTHG